MKERSIEPFARVMLLLCLLVFGQGCAVLRLGHAMLAVSSEMITGPVGAYASVILGERVNIPTIPPPKRGSTQPSVSEGLYQQAMTAYKGFEYPYAATLASRAAGESESRQHTAQAYQLEGACYYLMDDLDQAEQNFRRAKHYGASSMDSKIFPADMIRCFEGVD